MAEAAVTFLLQQLTEVVKEYIDLIAGAEDEFDQLSKDLDLLKAFLKDSAAETKNKNRLREIEKQIREVVYEVEDTIDTCLTTAMEAKAKEARSKVIKPLRKVFGSKTVSMAKEVKAIREGKVRPLYDDEARMKFAAMPINDEPSDLQDSRTKVKRLSLPSSISGTISFDFGDDQSSAAVKLTTNSRIFHNTTIEIFYDLSAARYKAGPEPLDSYYGYCRRLSRTPATQSPGRTSVIPCQPPQPIVPCQPPPSPRYPNS